MIKVPSPWHWLHGVALFIIVFGVVDSGFAVAQPRLSLLVRIFVVIWFFIAVAAAGVSFARGPSYRSISVLAGAVAIGVLPYAATGGADKGILLTMAFFGLGGVIDAIVLEGAKRSSRSRIQP